MSTITMKKAATLRRLCLGLIAGAGLLAFTESSAQAQELLLTGPLAGAPAVRKLRLYRQGRFQITPSATITILDEYQRTVMPGIDLQYNLTDWLSLGFWGAFVPDPLHVNLDLTEQVQKTNKARKQACTAAPSGPEAINCRLTAVNLGSDFTKQVGQIDWVAAPQVTGVPFRGKLSLFRSIYVDTEIYFFAGAAFIGLQERGECGQGACSNPATSFKRESRVAIAPTGGLGFTFWASKFIGLSLQYRLMPFSYNQGGFDTAGGGKNQDFPDGKINSQDRNLRMTMMFSAGLTFFLPTKNRLSE